MAVSLTIAAASGLVGGVSSFDFPFPGEQKDVGAHPLTVLRAGGDNDRGGKLKRTGFGVRIEKAGRGNLDTLSIEYGSLEVNEESFIIFGEIAGGRPWMAN